MIGFLNVLHLYKTTRTSNKYLFSNPLGVTLNMENSAVINLLCLLKQSNHMVMGDYRFYQIIDVFLSIRLHTSVLLIVIGGTTKVKMCFRYLIVNCMLIMQDNYFTTRRPKLV